MADLETIREIVAHLGTYHGAAYTPEAEAVFVAAFEGTSAELLADATARWCQTHLPSALAPTARDLRTCCGDVIALRRGEPRTPPPSTTQAGVTVTRTVDAIAKDTAELVRRTRLPHGHPQRLDTAGMAAEMRRLHGVYPGCGWADAAVAFEQQVARDREATAAARRRYAEMGWPAFASATEGDAA